MCIVEIVVDFVVEVECVLILCVCNRIFIECKEVIVVINVVCCYYLLIEEFSNDKKEFYGFLMSEGVSNLGLELGRSVCEFVCEVRF